MCAPWGLVITRSRLRRPASSIERSSAANPSRTVACIEGSRRRRPAGLGDAGAEDTARPPRGPDWRAAGPAAAPNAPTPPYPDRIERGPHAGGMPRRAATLATYLSHGRAHVSAPVPIRRPREAPSAVGADALAAAGRPSAARRRGLRRGHRALHGGHA